MRFLLRVKLGLEARVLNRVALLKAQVEPVHDAGDEGKRPGQPDVDWRGRINQISRALAVLVRQDELGEENTAGEPAEASLNGLVLAHGAAPRLLINVGLAVGDRSEAKPEKQARNREEVLGRDEQGVVDEEAGEEMDE